MHTRLIHWMLLSVLLAGVQSVSANTDSYELLRSYYRYHLTEETTAQAERLGVNGTSDMAQEIASAAGEWRSGMMDEVRSTLTARFGDEAATVFQNFVSDYTVAVEGDDPGYLMELAVDADLEELPSGYANLRAEVMRRDLETELASAANLLSRIEIWVSLKTAETATIPLADWLAVDEASVPGSAPSAPKRPSNPLRAAEAPLQTYDEVDMPELSTMEVMGDLRRKRREQALENAQEGMRQVAEERRAYEEEAAAVKEAKARGEAEAMKAQAQKLAASEKEAIEQQQNTWGNRLKRVVGATVSSTVCAFTGGVGSVAAERAVQEVFR